MTEYDGLNDNLRPVDSPAVKATEDRTTGYEFNSQNERDAITATNIQNFSFSTGRGGTLTLGGTANGNGYLSIKNDAGDIIVVGDNHGLTVNDGSIIIKNSGGTTSLDASGVVSNSNFQGVSLFSSGTYSAAGTSYTDVASSSLTTLVISRTTKVLVFAFVYGWNVGWIPQASNNMVCEARIKEGNSGSLLLNNFFTGNAETYVDFDSFSGLINGVTYTERPQSIYRQGIQSLTAGTYDFSLVHHTLGDGTSQIFNYEIGYIVLGT